MIMNFFAIIDDAKILNFACKIYSTEPEEIMKEAKTLLLFNLPMECKNWEEIRLYKNIDKEDIEKYSESELDRFKIIIKHNEKQEFFFTFSS